MYYILHPKQKKTALPWEEFRTHEAAGSAAQELANKIKDVVIMTQYKESYYPEVNQQGVDNETQENSEKLS